MYRKDIQFGNKEPSRNKKIHAKRFDGPRNKLSGLKRFVQVNGSWLADGRSLSLGLLLGRTYWRFIRFYIPLRFSRSQMLVPSALYILGATKCTSLTPVKPHACHKKQRQQPTFWSCESKLPISQYAMVCSRSNRYDLCRSAIQPRTETRQSWFDKMNHHQAINDRLPMMTVLCVSARQTVKS